MKALLMLFAATLTAQPMQYRANGLNCSAVWKYGDGSDMPAVISDLDYCPLEKRLQWWRRLEPVMDLDLRPIRPTEWNLGTATYIQGGPGFRNVYLLAPNGLVVIFTTDGRRLEITAEEINKRATAPKETK